MGDNEKPQEAADIAGQKGAGGYIDRDPVFYYSREHRLSRASPEVQALNDGKPIRMSLSKTLFATRSHRILFLVIIFTCVSLVLGNRFSGRDSGVKLGGNTLTSVIVREEGVLLLGITKNAPKFGEAYVGAVDIVVSPVMPKPKEGEAQEFPPLFTHRIYFNPSASETFSLTLPFEGTDFFVILRNDSEQKSLRLMVKP